MKSIEYMSQEEIRARNEQQIIDQMIAVRNQDIVHALLKELSAYLSSTDYSVLDCSRLSRVSSGKPVSLEFRIVFTHTPKIDS